MTELLWATYLIMTLFSYIIFQKDIAAPPFIFCGLYFFSITMALISKEEWQVAISDDSFIVFLFGGLIFIVLGVFFRGQNSSGSVWKNTGSLDAIEIPKLITVIIIIIAIITGYMQYQANMEIAAKIGASGSSALVLAAVREATSYGTEISIPSYIVQMNKVLSIFAYVWLFIYINNGVVCIHGWRRIEKLVPVCIYLVNNLLSGNRLLLLYISGAGFIYYYLMLTFCCGIKIDSGKILRRVLTLFILLMIGFYGVRLLAGRVGSEESALLQYISLYAGGPIKLFDMFLEAPVVSDLWGKETFIAIHKNLQALGLENYPVYIAHKEFREVNGVGVGNVYTAYRAWFADFGFAGIVILGGAVATFYNYFYYKLRFSNLNQHRFALLIYGYMSSGLFLHSIDDDFYPYFVSLGFISIFLIFYAVYYFTIKLRSK